MPKREFIIDKNVDIPIKVINRKPEYPFQYMDVRESFFIPGANQNTIQSAILRFKKSDKGTGKVFTARTVSEVVKGEEEKGEQEGVRVWRTT